MTVNGQEETAEARPAPICDFCPVGSQCIDGKCVEAKQCKEDTDCPYNQYCTSVASLSSVDSEIDDSSKTCNDICLQCKKGYTSCTPIKDSHQANCTYGTTNPCAVVRCTSGTTCVAVGSTAMCVPTCTYDRECPCHQLCMKGACRDPCAGEPCSRGTTCKSLGGNAICVDPVKCSSEKDCSSDQLCLDGVCTNFGCTTNDDCDDNKQCYYAHGYVDCNDPCDLVKFTCPNGFKKVNHQCDCA